MKIYRGMTRVELDAAYNNRAAVGDWQDYMERWAHRSADLYASARVVRDIAFGPRPRQRLDLFLADAPGRPILYFLHGGYWQWNDKEGQAFAARGPLAHGFNVAVGEYSLCPAAGIADIVAEVHAAVDWLAAHAGEYAADAAGIVVSGISAGAHLAATQLGRPEVKAGLLISGLYDLEPIRLSWLNDAIGMDAATAARFSPLLHLPAASGPVVFAVGADERPELCRQTRDYHTAWTAAGLRGRHLPIAAANHFSVLEQLAAPDGLLTAALLDLCREAGLNPA